MARLNIEDDLFLDIRFQALARRIGERTAIGEWVSVAMTAQRYWGKGKQLIPYEIWEISDFSEELIKCQLVKKTEDGYYLCGSEDQFDWYLKLIESGKKGVSARKLKRRKQTEHIESGNSSL